MAKNITKSYVWALKVAVVSFSFPLLLTGNSWAQKQGNDQQVIKIAQTNSPTATASPSPAASPTAAASPSPALSQEAEIASYIQKFRTDDFRVYQDALRDLERIGTPAVPALIEALQDKDVRVRVYAADVLGALGSKAQEAVPALAKALKDPDQYVRASAAEALHEIGSQAKDAVTELIGALKDEDRYVRYSAADALGRIGPEAKTAVPALIETLKDKDPYVRYSAADTLEAIGEDAKDAVKPLIETLKDEDEYVRAGSAAALGAIGEDAKDAVPKLMDTLAKDKSGFVRSRAANALGDINWQKKSTVPALIDALQDKDQRVRSAAAIAIGEIGSDSPAAIPALIQALQEDDDKVRSSAAEGVGEIAGKLQDKATKLSIPALNSIITDLEIAVKVLEDPKANFKDSQIAQLKRPLVGIKAEKEARLSDRFSQWLAKNPFWTGALLYFTLLPSTWWLLLRLRPLWLLALNEALEPFSNIQLTGFMRGTKLSLRAILLISFFTHNSRVLDAWVAKYIKAAREEFGQKDAVSDRSIHIPVPITIDGKPDTQLTASDLQTKFNQQQCNLVIWGEGGSGKTSIACQMAKWAMAENQADRLCDHLMLPILIEEDLDIKVDKKADKKAEKTKTPPFIDAIRGHLQDLINEVKPISEELLERLLQEQRILVIVDRFSELNDATRGEIRPESPEFPVNSLVITSRFEEKLGRVNKTILKPQRIEGTNLASFVEAYIKEQGKRDKFTDLEFFDGCGQLSLRIGSRSVTLLLVKMYAEQMIEAKEKDVVGELASGIPDLMLTYLNELNGDISDGKLDNRTIHKDAKALAWECLKTDYRAGVVKRKDAIAALGDKSEDRLKYLENRLRLIQTVGPAQDQIRFTLDPLAEYLAGLQLLELNGDKEEAWREFLDKAIAKTDAQGGTQGLFLAVRDCCVAYGRDAKVPNFVVEELGVMTGLTPAPEPAQVIEVAEELAAATVVEEPALAEITSAEQTQPAAINENPESVNTTNDAIAKTEVEKDLSSSLLQPAAVNEKPESVNTANEAIAKVEVETGSDSSAIVPESVQPQPSSTIEPPPPIVSIIGDLIAKTAPDKASDSPSFAPAESSERSQPTVSE